MSVVLECQTGDEMVCVMDFHAAPEGEQFSWDTSRQFHVGERVRYAGSRQHAQFKDRPNGWVVTFEASDGKRYAATQTYFVTQECWRALEQHFCQARAPA